MGEGYFFAHEAIFAISFAEKFYRLGVMKIMNWYSSFIKAMIEDITPEKDLAASAVGCSENELLIVMQNQNVERLPELYRQFMLQMGNGYSQRIDDMLWTISELELVRETDFVDDGMFIMMAHYMDATYLFGFQTLDADDDPNMWEWNESFENENMIEMGIRLSDFLLDFFVV